MRIDHTHKVWGLCSAAALLLALAAYVPYAALSAHGPRGGTAMGLIFGGVGYGLMLFAVLLSLRKKFPVWRIGRAQTWMRGHLWLGLLSYPIILLHAGLHFGHGLALAMMLILTIVVLSGIAGAALQHYMPRVMTERVPLETIYDQIDRVRSQLLKEADELLSAISDTNAQYGVLVPAVGTHGTATTLLSVEFRAAVQVRGMYEKQVRSYLERPGGQRHRLADRSSAKLFFGRMRTLAPAAIHQIVDDLENICLEKRDLDRQARLHRLLHGWLLLHVPLSFALIVMGAIHAIMALRY